MISVAVLIIAFGVTRLYLHFFRGKSPQPKPQRRTQPSPGIFTRFVDDFGGPFTLVMHLALAVVAFITLYLLFYSSFSKNPKGILDSFQTFAIWTRTGTVAHVHPAYTYITWLVRQEAPLLFLGAIGAAVVVLRPRNSFALFAALWAFGLLAAYSLIPYKTPWLLLNFIVPLALIAGYAVQAIYELDKRQLRLTGVVLFIAAAVASYQTVDLNFINYDNDNSYYVYVYAHTKRGTIELVDKIDEIAKQEAGGLTGISILSPDYWPLPWYLRNYSRVGYYGRLAPSTEPILIANENQKAEIESEYGEVYQQVASAEPGGSFELRPGVKLVLYERRKGLSPPAELPPIRQP